MGLFGDAFDYLKGAVGTGVKILGGTIGTAVAGPLGGAVGAGLAGTLFGKTPGRPKTLSSTPGIGPGGAGGSWGSGSSLVPYGTIPPASGGSFGANLFAADVVGVTEAKEARAPKGYRVHTVTPSTAPLLGKSVGSKVSVRLGSEAARILGVRRSKKPVLSVRDSEAIKRSARAKKRVANVAKGAGLHVYTSPRSTGRGSTRRK